MSGVTGIELGPNYCVLVRGGRLGAHRTVSAASVIMPPAWPFDRAALVERLKAAKHSNDLSSRARVVAWGDEGTLSPLTDAGFEIASVLSPAQALARVVRARQVGAPPGTAVAALSLNSHGVAIAIVAGAEVIHSRVFEWPLGTPFAEKRAGERGARSELLDRYLLVSQIAPQLQHDIELVRPVHGATVISVVACGNLPNLRSLAMLLIEEMDLEVETLDSAELLDPDGAPATLSDAVASLQLAAAVASPGESRVPVHTESETASGANVHVEVEHPSPRPSRFSRNLEGLAAVAALVLGAAWSSLQIAGSSPARPIFPGGMVPAVMAAVPERHELRTEATTGRESLQVPSAEPDTAPASAPEPAAARPTRRRAADLPAASKVPLPSVDGVLIAGSHRLAIVGGLVVAVGDPVGPRVIARIERDGVVLREPSGREIFVAIRPRKPPSLGS